MGTKVNVRKLVFKPEFHVCLKCGHFLKYAYPVSRKTVNTLSGSFHVTHHGYSCPNCSTVFRSAEAESLCLKHFSYGFDVIAKVGQLRFQVHKNREEIHQILTTHYDVDISERNVQNLYELYSMLLQTSAEKALDQILPDIHENGGMVIAIDGVQPEKGHETLYVIREVLTRTVLAAKCLQNSSSENIEEFLKQVARPGIKIIGVVSDGQSSLKLGISKAFPGVPHQLCHYHFLRNIAFQFVGKDRKMKKEIKKKVRGISAIEKRVPTELEGEECDVVLGYLQAVRALLVVKGKAPLYPPGIMVYEYLQLIKESINDALLHKENADLNSLLTILKKTDTFTDEYTSLKLSQSWVVKVANILDPEEYKDMSPEAGKEQAQTDLRGFLLELEELEKEHPEHKLLIRDIIKMTHSYWDGLFACFANPLIPRTNNDLEQFFRALKSGHRRVTGRMSWDDYIIRIGEFAVFDLKQDISQLTKRIQTVSYEELAEVRKLWDKRVENSRRQGRFRKDPKQYLDNLLDKWKKS
jgi:hypothetical protein